MNPAIDLFIHVEKLIAGGAVNRTLANEIMPNGKGVNIAFLLKTLGIDSTALGFIAGFTGRFIESELLKKGIKTGFVVIDGVTRINVFTKVESEGRDYQLVNSGPAVTPACADALLAKIGALTEGDILCVSGSNPPGTPPDILQKIAGLSRERGFDLVLDSSSPAARSSLFCKPLLLKPTLEELALWFNQKSIDPGKAVGYAKTLIDEGARHILVSMGKDGAYYVSRETALYANAPRGTVVNTACAGDTMVASFLYGLETGKSAEENLRFAVASASSTAFRPGLTDYSDVDALIQNVYVRPC